MTDERGRLAVLRRWTGTDEAVVADADLALESLRRRRDRRAATSTVAAIGARGVALLASFIAIPLSIGFLGLERYGILVAVTSLTAMLVFADLGLGNGLLNVMSEAHGRNDRRTASGAVSSAFFMLIAIAAAVTAVFAVVYPFVNWARLLGTTGGTAGSEVGPAVAVVVGLFVLALPLGVIERVRMAYQEGFINSLAAVVAAILGFCALLVAIALRASLPVLILATSAAPLAALAFNGYRLFRRDRPWLRPRLRHASISMARGLGRIGFLFLALQVAVVVAFQSDVIVAATILGPEAAATYAVTMKFFLLTPILLSLYFATLWPAYTEALARNDVAWVRRTLRRSVWIAALSSGLVSLVLLLGGAAFIRWWTGGAVDPPFGLILGAAIWATVNGVFNAVSILLNAASVILFQVVIAVLMAIASITMSIVLANLAGIAGIIWGTLVAYLLFSAIPILVFLPGFLRGVSEGRHAPANA